MQSISKHDVSLYGGIPPRRPLDLELMRGNMPFDSPLMDSGGVETLEGSNTVQKVLGKLKEERYTLSFSVSPIFMSLTALIDFAAWLEDRIFMMED